MGRQNSRTVEPDRYSNDELDAVDIHSAGGYYGRPRYFISYVQNDGRGGRGRKTFETEDRARLVGSALVHHGRAKEGTVEVRYEDSYDDSPDDSTPNDRDDSPDDSTPNDRDDSPDDSTPNDRDDSPETDAYGRAIWSALNASALKAGEVREDASYAVLDRVAQSALERSALSGVRFDRAHTEVHSLLYYLVEETDRDMSAVSSTLDRLRHELLRLERLDETDDSEADEDDSPLLTDGGGRETETEVETVEFKHRQPDSPDTLPGRGPELDPGETWADCSLCGYSGVVERTTAFSADRLRCRSCSPEADSAVVEDEDEDDSPLLTDGGQPRDDADPNPDDADPDSPTLLRVRAVREETPSHVSVYYAVGPITFRADLRTALRNDDLVAPGEAFSLVRLVSYSPEQDPLDDDTQPADTHELTHVPPVVRGAVDRPVQVDVPPEFTEL